MLELSFIFLVFFSLLMGSFDFGQFLFLHQALVERARYAARWGMATTGATTRNIKNIWRWIHDYGSIPIHKIDATCGCICSLNCKSTRIAKHKS